MTEQRPERYPADVNGDGTVDDEEKRIRATSFANSLSTEELAAVRDRLVAEG